MNARVLGTVARVNVALRKLGVQERLVRGKGYHYFAGGRACDWPETAVWVYLSESLTVQEWLDEYCRLRNAGDQLTSPQPQPPASQWFRVKG